MIVIKVIGGLGNQMFQYAVAKSLAIEKNKKVYLDLSGFDDYELHNYGLHNFNIEGIIYKKPNKYINKLVSYFRTQASFGEKTLGYHEEVFNLKADKITLRGYFQSQKYFIKHEKEIRNNFQLLTPIKKITSQTIEKMQKVNSVALHIRRGDFLTTQLHNTNKDLYYKKAVTLIEDKIENPTFFVFSDDMDWVKQNFSINHETFFVDFNDALTNYEDMKLMASCKHNIIANSSFSWWSAWLNNNPDKVVIAPKQWLTDVSRITKDIIPENWIKI